MLLGSNCSLIFFIKDKVFSSISFFIKSFFIMPIPCSPDIVPSSLITKSNMKNEK